MQDCFLKLGLPEAVAQLLARSSSHDNVSLDPSALTAVCVDLTIVKAFTLLACRHGISKSLSTHTYFRQEPVLSQIKEALLLVSAERSRGDEYAAAASSIANSTHREVTAARGIQEQHADVVEELRRTAANMKEVSPLNLR
jgi:hypothetical protein